MQSVYLTRSAPRIFSVWLASSFFLYSIDLPLSSLFGNARKAKEPDPGPFSMPVSTRRRNSWQLLQARSSLSLVGQAKTKCTRPPRCISSPQNNDLCQVNIVIDNISLNEHALKQKINFTQLVHTNLPKNWLRCSFLLANSLATATMSRLFYRLFLPTRGCTFHLRRSHFRVKRFHRKHSVSPGCVPRHTV